MHYLRTNARRGCASLNQVRRWQRATTAPKTKITGRGAGPFLLRTERTPKINTGHFAFHAGKCQEAATLPHSRSWPQGVTRMIQKEILITRLGGGLC